MRAKMRWVPWVVAFGVLLLLPAATTAQETEVQFVDADGNPIPGTDVSVLFNRIKFRSGTTNAEGKTTVTQPIPPGTETAIVEETCRDPELSGVVIVPEGEEHECGEDCECKRRAVVPWGTGDLVVRLPGFPGEAVPEVAPRAGFSGYIIPAYKLTRFSEVQFESGNVAESTWSSGGSLYGGVMLGNHVWGMIGGHIVNVDRDLVVGGSRRTVDYHGYSVGAGVRFLPVKRPRLNPFLAFMGLFNWNKGDFEFDGTTDHRVHKTWSYEVGGGVTAWLSERVGLDMEFDYRPAVKGEDDADEGLEIKTGVIYNFGNVCGGQCGGRR